jgi:putative hemolysin
MDISSGSEVPPVTFLASTMLVVPHSIAFVFSLGWLFIPLVLVALLFLSALFSASENAFFSLSQNDIESLSKQNKNKDNLIEKLVSKPGLLLSTILVGNNLVNIAFVVLASVFIEENTNFELYPWLEFPLKVLIVTFLLLVFGEVIPKTFATRNNRKTALTLAPVLFKFQNLFYFLIAPLAKSAIYFDKKIKRNADFISAEQLTHAIDITTEISEDNREKSILKGIVNFGNTEARQIMLPRVDVCAVEFDSDFKNLLETVKKEGFSRMPVFKETFDQIVGVIYTKDLLPHIEENENFEWTKLIKPAFFVPETKKIDDLLKEFQEKRVHIAIVTDEYGGKQGIVTMEDILEEIFGEIHDEFDVKEENFKVVGENIFMVDAKMLINDFCKLAEVDENTFEEVEEVAETIGGVILELAGTIPIKGQSVRLKNLIFTIESADKRKIKKVRIEHEI